MPHSLHPTIKLIGIWLLMKAFSNGCAAMTGVEAVSNGVMAFGEPRTKNAQRTLTVIIGILIILLFGTAWLAQKYQIMAMDPDHPDYQSLLSLIVQAVFGRGWFYHFTMWSVFLALCLSANTAFADFPRLTRAIAMHDYLPHVFIMRGRRLLFSHGIYALTGLTAVILIMFGGITDRLISLYAIGAFLAFTLSQAGMVHALEEGGPGAQGPQLAHVRQRHRRGGHRHHHHHRADRQVHLRRVGDGAAGPHADPADGRHQAALHPGQERSCAPAR